MISSSEQKVTGPAQRGAGYGSAQKLGRSLAPYLGVLPFFLLVGVFLFWPTIYVVAGAFNNADGTFGLETIRYVIADESHIGAFKRSIQLSVATALIGAFFGGLLAWAVSVGKRDGALRRVILAASGVFAQFGGVMLAFAFLATFGFNGMLTVYLLEYFGEGVLTNPTWLYGMAGLILVYTFFQIPLMMIVFLPAIENLKPQWREASESLGGTTREYWKNIGGPILIPSFTGALLLLFANAFSAYATAVALISQGSPLVPLQISKSISSEVARSNPALSKTLALGMIIIVAIVMSLYVLLQRRVAKWTR